MTHHVLTAVPTGMRAHGYTRVALVQYTGPLDHKRLKINERFNGLRILHQGTFSHRGDNNMAQRMMVEWSALADCLNNGSLIV